MKSRQVGLVLVALIFIGLAGLIIRLVSTESSELTLDGILPVTPEVINKVTISGDFDETTLVKVAGIWQIGRDLTFDDRMAALWGTVREIDGAQLIAVNPASHSRMGVQDGQGIRVSFYRDEFIQEEFIVGLWTPEVRFCYMRRPGKDEVYGVPCPFTNIFDPDPNSWRNPLVTSIPRGEIERIEFAYPDEEFVLAPGGRGWTVDDGSAIEPASLFVIEGVLRNIERLVAGDFATMQEAQGLDFNGPDAISIRIVTGPDALSPTTRIRLLPRDDLSYYAKTPVQSTVFILGNTVTELLLLRAQDIMASGG
ncbi:MAG: DUF4340 domain-containing protein [Chloroflexi bacterium]|nr:DUF4340 domain-containing protein [Chloroflexota bacterium]